MSEQPGQSGPSGQSGQVEPGSIAAKADRHVFYERAVQAPEEEVAVLDLVYSKLKGRRPLTLREDFCGTALLCSRWVESDPRRRAIGVDLDSDTLAWARKHRIDPLGERGRSIELVCGDVRSVATTPVDVVAAFNFSYCLIHDRQDLVDYFKAAREALAPEGLFVLDTHQGPRSQEELLEETEFEDFVYVWEQGPIDAPSGTARRAIHFEFNDGSELENAFEYEFRVWTLPELIDALRDAGFERTDLFYEEFDEDGYSVGELHRVERLTHEDSWIGYLVCE